MVDKLTDKEKALVQGVVAGKEQAEAYAEAGYSVHEDVQVNRSNCQNILNKPHVKAYRQQQEAKLQTKAETELSITRDRQNKRLEKIIKESMDGSFKQVVVKDIKGGAKLDKQGKPITQFNYQEPDLPTAIRAIQELSKLNGLYEPDKIEHSMAVTAMTEQDIHAEFERLAGYDTDLPNDE
tara:strand:+ start:1328 stop:1870 length:543 start_codon:yes stop_codon:yes gene_type:complete